MILAETCPSCSYLITWFVGLLLKITLKGLLVDWKCLWSMFVIWFLNITHKSRNFHAFTQAYLAHAQTNFPAAQYIPISHESGDIARFGILALKTTLEFNCTEKVWYLAPKTVLGWLVFYLRVIWLAVQTEKNVNHSEKISSAEEFSRSFCAPLFDDFECR